MSIAVDGDRPSLVLALFSLTPDDLRPHPQYPSRDLRLGLVEASEGKIGTPVDQVLLFCYHYDASTGKYGLLISRLIQAAAAVTVLAIAGLVLVLYRKENYALPERRA